jgi:hypothetical protein
MLLIIVNIGRGYLKIENRGVGKAFGPKREEVTRDWRKLHNEGLTNFALHQILFMTINKSEMGGACDTYGGKSRDGNTILVGMSEIRRPSLSIICM